MVVGIIGALLILGAWIIETRKIIKSKNVDDIDPRFLIVYLLGSLLLTYYSAQISDLVFVMLSAVISVITLIELVFVFMKKH